MKLETAIGYLGDFKAYYAFIEELDYEDLSA